MTQLELHIEPDWRERLERAGFADLIRLLTAELGREVQRKPERAVRYLALPGTGPGLYLKRFGAPTLRTQLASLARGERAGRGEREARELARVLGAGLRASRPIAWGCVRRFGLEREALLITEEVRGVALPRALADAAPSAVARRRRIDRAPARAQDFQRSARQGPDYRRARRTRADRSRSEGCAQLARGRYRRRPALPRALRIFAAARRRKALAQRASACAARLSRRRAKPAAAARSTSSRARSAAN